MPIAAGAGGARREDEDEEEDDDDAEVDLGLVSERGGHVQRAEAAAVAARGGATAAVAVPSLTYACSFE